jgi:hypothetical protein
MLVTAFPVLLPEGSLARSQWPVYAKPKNKGHATAATEDLPTPVVGPLASRESPPPRRKRDFMLQGFFCPGRSGDGGDRPLEAVAVESFGTRPVRCAATMQRFN